VIQSEHCGVEFRKFLDREKALSRSDLIFPILYIDVPELHEDRVWRNHPTLKVIGARQYVNWCDFRFEPDGPQVRRATAQLCTNIGAALRRNVKVIEPSSAPMRPTAPPAQPAPIPASIPEPSAPSPPSPEPFTVVDPIEPPVARNKWRASRRSADDQAAHMGVSSRGHFGRPDFARFLALLLVVAALAGTIGGFAVIEYFMNKMGWLNGGFIADYLPNLVPYSEIEGSMISG
jgi:hypothetical protein